MEFIFKHFAKLWLLWFTVAIVTALSVLGVGVWAVIKLVSHYTA